MQNKTLVIGLIKATFPGPEIQEQPWGKCTKKGYFFPSLQTEQILFLELYLHLQIEVCFGSEKAAGVGVGKINPVIRAAGQQKDYSYLQKPHLSEVAAQIITPQSACNGPRVFLYKAH